MNLKGLLLKLKSETAITALSASFLLSFTLLFFGPATLYYSNFFEFYFTFSDIFNLLIGASIIFGIVLAFLALLFKGKNHQKFVCVIFALGLLFYIQGNILVWDYGLFEGHEIIWNNYLINGLIDSVIWIAVLTLSFFKSDKIYKFIPVACFFLLIIQTVGILALVHFAPDEPQWKSYYFVDDGSKFEFSEKTNIIIIILDSFQSDVFQEIINENESYQNMFAGFTYYRNAVGGYPTTIASIPLILTGKYYKNSLPYDAFIQESYESSSLPKILKENGYNVEIYESPRYVYPNENIVSNIKKRSVNSQNIFSQVTPLAKLTLFRHSFHFLKKEIYFNLIEQLTNRGTDSDGSLNYGLMSFNDGLMRQTFHLNDTPTFKFYHLMGAHPPYQLNEQLEYEELPFNRMGNKEQSKASLRIVGNLLKKLKEQEIFDKSIILVVADHGRSDNGYIMNNSQLYSNKQLYISQYKVASGIPLILVKPLNSSRPITISDAPVSLSDIPISVATELNLSNTFTGESFFTVNDSDNRNFTFYDIYWTPEFENWEYLPPLHEYMINNFSWDAASWYPTYRVYTSNGVEIKEPPYCNLGTTIKFGKDQQFPGFLISGWSYPDEGSTWSDGKSATIAFSMKRSNSTLLNIDIVASPYIVGGKHELQRVTVSLNQHELGNYSFTRTQSQKMDFLIPSNYLNEQVQYLTFYFPDAISPLELGMSSDPRNLAIALTSVNITELNSD